MLCTVIHDAYTADEQSEVHEALSTLLSAGQPDWSAKGVYAYWDRAGHDILYLGLASDLPSRFAQHNGLVNHGGGNKAKEIRDYFSGHERLGFTMSSSRARRSARDRGADAEAGSDDGRTTAAEDRRGRRASFIRDAESSSHPLRRAATVEPDGRIVEWQALRDPRSGATPIFSRPGATVCSPRDGRCARSPATFACGCSRRRSTHPA